MEALGLEKKFARAFDLFMLPGHTSSEQVVTLESARHIVLVELKTTRKKLPHNPRGFFFGATQNEFDLADRLGEQYKFCFVSLHPESLSHALVTAKELEKHIVHRRVQYQINL